MAVRTTIHIARSRHASWWALALLLVWATAARAQHSYNIEYITTESGLPSDGVKGLQWDEANGYLWIATEGGLVRYNGQQLYTFNKENTGSITTDRFFPLTKDAAGHIIALTEKKTFRTEANMLVPYEYQPPEQRGAAELLYVYVHNGPPPGSATYITNYNKMLPVDSNHVIIEGGDTLYEYTAGTAQRKALIGMPHEAGSFMIGSSIYVYDNNDGFYTADIKTGQLTKVPVAYGPGDSSRLPAGKKHLYWEAGMANPVLLAGTYAWMLEYHDGAIHPRLICTEIPQNYAIRHIQYWQKGEILFLGTLSKGIIVIRKNYLANVKKNNSGFDEPNAIYSQILLSNGNILANTGDIIGPYKGTVKELPIRGSFNNNIFLTRDSVLWYTKNDSLSSYDYKTGVRKFCSRLEGSYNIAYASTNNMIFVANTTGVMMVTDKGLNMVYRFNGHGDPFDMAELQPGVLAVATSKGLFKLNIGTGRLDTLLVREAPVRCLWKYRNYLFIGTYGEGIFILRGNTVAQLPVDNSNYLRYTHCFITDDSGYCWMSTNRGLFKARLQDMLDAYEHGTQYVYYHFYGKNEGMDITEMNGGCKPCAIKLQNKEMSFPTMDGALWVSPEMPSRMPDGNVFIDQVTANGKKVNGGYKDSIVFSSRVNDIVVGLGFSAWCDKENIYIQYTLDSLSKNWQNADINHPQIHLSNLAPGKYRLYIRKLKGFGTNNYAVHRMSFEIEAPWYMDWWGIMIIVLAALVAITITALMANRESIRRQMRLRGQLDEKTQEILKQNEKLEKNDRIKTRLISIISHDIITPLKFLHLTTKYLSEQKESLSKNLRDETLEEVVNTSRELELLSTNILNWIKYQNEERRIVKESINIHDMVEQLFTILKSLAHKNNTTLVNKIPVELMAIQLVDPLRIIIYNLMVNAINFTMDGSITIDAWRMNNSIELRVTDTGLGMNKSQITNLLSENVIISSANVNKRSGNGLGYLIIKDLLKMIDGTIDIKSKVGEGTAVVISFPVK